MRLRIVPLALSLLVARPLAGQRGGGAHADSAACSAVAVGVDSLVLHGRSAVPLVLWHETRPVRRRDVLPGYWRSLHTVPGLDATTWESFQRRNTTARRACRTVPLPNPLTLRSKRTDGPELTRTLDTEEFWRAFSARYGTSMNVATSAVGLSDDGRQALLVIDYGCGGLCGAGHVVLLERDTQHRWRIRYARMTWVS